MEMEVSEKSIILLKHLNQKLTIDKGMSSGLVYFQGQPITVFLGFIPRVKTCSMGRP